MPGIGGFILHGASPAPDRLMEKLRRSMRWADNYHERILAPPRAPLQAIATGRPFIPVSAMEVEQRYYSLLFGEIYPGDEGATERRAEDAHRALLQKWLSSGADVLNETDGAFLLLVWDNREQKLFLANDAFGLYPLNYSNRHDGFFFASQIRSVADLIAPVEFDETALAERMFLGFPLNGRTYLKDVHRLPAGSQLEYRDGHVSVTAYFRPAYTYGAGQSLQERLRAIKQAFEAGVLRRYRREERTSMALSGGFDTRLIWSVALNKNITASAATHGSANSADMVIAREITSARKIPHHAFDLDRLPPERFPEWAEQVTRMSDGLMSASSFFIIPYYQSLQENFDVLIDGAGGALYRRQHAATFEWQQKKGLRPEAFIFRLFLKPAFKQTGLFEEWKKAFTAPIRQELAEYFNETAALGAPADQVDLFYLQQIVGLLYSSDFLLQTHFINCREPYYDINTFAQARSFSPAERKKLTIHRHILLNNFPALAGFPLEFRDYPLPFSGFLWKRFAVSAAERMRMLLPGNKLKKFPPLFDEADFLRRFARDYLYDVLLAPEAHLASWISKNTREKILMEHFEQNVDHAALLFQLLSLELTLRLFSSPDANP